MPPERPLLLIQLAGAPGSGKSTLAAALATAYDAVVLDLDVVKTALLDADASWQVAGAGAYNTLFALADDLLARGHSVIVDSPSHYPQIPARGTAIAEQRDAAYRFLECDCPDDAERERRLGARTPRRSQVQAYGRPPADADRTSEAVRLGQHRWRTYGPDGGHLVLDSTRPLEELLVEAKTYVEG